MARNKTLKTTLATAFSVLALAAWRAPAAHAAAYHTLHGNPAGAYRIDPNHSVAWFTIGHAGVAVVVGRFDTLSGHYTFDPAKPARDQVAIHIHAASIDTGFPMRDHDLRGPDFLNVREFPNITFTSTRYQPTGRMTGRLYGRLTLHGVTRPVVFRIREIGAGPVTMLPKPWGGYLSGYEASTTIARSAFGVDAYPGMIANTVHLHVNIEGVRTSR